MELLNVGKLLPFAKIIEIMFEAKLYVLLGHIVSVDQYLTDLIFGFEILAFFGVVVLEQKFAVACSMTGFE